MQEIEQVLSIPKTNFGGGLDYGLENGPVLAAGDMSLGEFTDFLTNPKLDYQYVSNPTIYDTKDFWEDMAFTTSSIVDSATGFVWDTAIGTWDTIKSGATSVANAVTDAGTKIIDTGTSIFDGLLMRILLVFAVLVGGLWVLGKSGVLKDTAAILGKVL